MPLTREQETEYIEQVRSGNRDRFAELVNAYKGPVYNLAYRFTWDHAEAEDLAQEAFIKAYTNLDKFKYSMPFLPWLYTIALNIIRSHQKKKGRIFPLEYDQNLVSTDDPAGPESQVVYCEDIRRAIDALRRLPIRLKEAVILRYFEELPYDDVARLLKISAGAAKMRVKRGLALLKDMMEG